MPEAHWETEKQRIYELAEAVTDRDSFLEFIAELGADFRKDAEIRAKAPEQFAYSSGPLGWENDRIDTFLDAAYHGNTGSPEPPGANAWHEAAMILYVGKIYE